jgi:peptidoglycan/LPS O-acetylase OafA/YrhL
MLAYEAQQRTEFRSILTNGWASTIALASLGIGMTSAQAPKEILPMLCYAFFFVAVACGNSFWGFLQTRGALILGEFSYGIYLLHGTVLWIFFNFGPSTILNLSAAGIFIATPILGLATIALAALTYGTIELPMIRAGANVSKWLSGRRAKLSKTEINVAP